jgi:hypothetical protein
MHARAGEEITILRSIYADRKPSHRKPLHAKEKTSQTVLRVCVCYGAKEITALGVLCFVHMNTHTKGRVVLEKVE